VTEIEQTRSRSESRARGLVSSRESGSRIDVARREPLPGLSGVVLRYWRGQWDLRGQEPHRMALLADPCVNIVFEAGSSRVVGVSTRLFQRELKGRGRIRAAKLHPGMARAVLPQTAMSELADRMVPLHDLLTLEPGLEQDVLVADDDAGFNCLEGWLVRQVTPLLGHDMTLVRDIVQRLEATPAITRVAQLAEMAGVGVRALQHLFREHLGASPKWLIRRFRLREAATRLEQGSGPSLAALALDLGYSDQAHLSRDFKAATGHTPGRFARQV